MTGEEKEEVVTDEDELIDFGTHYVWNKELEEEEEEEVVVTDDEEKVTDENDPSSVEKVKDEEVLEDEDQEVGFDEVFANVQTKISDLTQYDKAMEKKMLEHLRGKKND